MLDRPQPSIDCAQSADDWHCAPCALAVVDSSFSIVRANKVFHQLSGLTEKNVEGCRLSQIFSKPSQIYFESILLPLLHIKGSCQEIALTILTEQEPAPVLVNIAARPNTTTRLYDIIIFPATERRSYEEQLSILKRDAERRASWLAQLETLSGLGAWTYEIKTKRMLWSDRIYELYGIAKDAEVSLEVALRPLAPELQRAIMAFIDRPDGTREPMVHEADFGAPPDQVRRFKIVAQHRLNDLGEPVIQGFLQDVTEAHHRQIELWRAAHVDQMTGLANRAYFQSELTRQTETNTNNVTIAYLDLDLFKDVNDQYGHSAGDDCLVEIGKRLRAQCTETQAFVARLGGDEFAILFFDKKADEIEDLVSSIIESIRQPICLSNGNEVILGVSVGLARYDSDDLTASSEVLRRADLAMYAAKTAGRNAFAWFDLRLDLDRKNTKDLDRDLKLALEQDEFFLVFQPQYNLHDRSLVGFEALLRWHHPTKGLVPPLEFIPIAEANGLIRPIGRWVMARACEFAKRMHGNTKVAVNVSALQFRDPDFVPFVLERVKSLDLAHGALEIELTESVLVELNPTFQAMIERLRAHGITIAIDDFGTGYSSLGYLSKFPFDVIKIDRSFISDLKSKNSLRILRSIIGMGSSINKKIVVEGIETLEQVEFLRSFQSLVAQGYFFGKPVKLDQAVDIARQSYLMRFDSKKNFI